MSNTDDWDTAFTAAGSEHGETEHEPAESDHGHDGDSDAGPEPADAEPGQGHGDDSDATDTPATEAAADPLYPDVESWVTHWLAPIYRRKFTRDMTWCPQWWQHGEAILRLEALWRTWEQLRTEGNTAMSVYLRDHLDPQMAVLLNRESGPFALCTSDGHHTLADPLPVQPAPAGWWPGPAAPAKQNGG